MHVSKNREIILETLFLNHSAFFPNASLIRTNITTSIKSAIPKAIRLASEIRADCLNIRSYDGSFFINRIDGGRDVAKRENRKRRKIMTIPDRIILLVLSAPYTSVMMSFIEYISGIKNSETLP
jgi:hypothetical protein